MKKIFYILAAAVLTLASCSKDIEKSTIEAGFDALQPLPTVTIEKVGDYDPVSETLPVDVKFSGLAGIDNLSMGVLVSTDPTFKQSSFIKGDKQADGTYTFNVPGAAKKKNYIMGVAACNSGTAYSASTAYDYPDIAWFKKIRGTYKAAAVESYFGDKYDFAVTVSSDPEDPMNKVIVDNLDPYFAKNGFEAPKANRFVGYIVEDGLIVVPFGQKVGYKDVILAAFNDVDPDEADDYDNLYISIDEDGAVMTIENAYGTMDEGGWWELYYGGFSLKK